MPVLACIWFTFCGLVFIPYAGIQNDEALFAGPLYSQLPREYRIRSFHHDVPLMLMSYLGALKTWVYGAVFSVWKPDSWSVRVPVVIAGAFSVWLFFLLLKRAAGLRAALIGSVLLATDTTFLLTTTFDWGPVAFQHLLLIGGMALAVAAYQDANGPERNLRGGIPWKLGWAFLLFGLGMWDKAIFIWVLCGLAVAAVSIFRREVWQMVTRRSIVTAAAAFCLGALPLIVYNVRNPLKTFRGNASFSTAGFVGKAQLVQFTMNGSALFGYLVEEERVESPKPPRSTLERMSVAIRNTTGQQRSGLLFWAFVAALALAPVWARQYRRTILFVLMTMIVAWLQMALNKDTGGGVHHVVLLWPLPHIIIAVALSAAAARLQKWARPLLIASLTLVCGANLLVTNQYLSQFVRNGAAAVWSDAIFPLSAAIRQDPNQNLFVTDWGVFDTLRLLHQGKLRLWVGSEPLMDPEPTATDLAAVQRMLTVPSPLFICHTKRYEVFNGAAERLANMAQRLGYQKEIVRTISDTNGRPVFELVQFNRLTTANPQALSTFARKSSADPPAAPGSPPPRS